MEIPARAPRRAQASRTPRGPAGDVFRKLGDYARLMRINRPIGALLLLWPTLWALWIAGAGQPDMSVVAVFVAGVFVMRAAGCVINDYADRHIDARVERTRDRPLATGRVSEREALVLFALLLVLAFMLVLTQNRFTVALAFAGAGLATGYPFMKRYTHLPQVFLGVAFAWGIPMAFAALTDAVAPVAWLMVTGVALWAVIYDTMYAMVDREDDQRIGVKSTAILFGDADRVIIAITQVFFLIALLLVGEQAGLGVWYQAGVGVAALLSLYQQWLIRERDRAGCFSGFLNNNWLGAAVFAGIVADYGLPAA